MSDNMKELSPKQKRAIEALSSSGNIAQAAQVAGVSRDTIYRWMKAPAFQEATREAEAEALNNLSRSLVRLARQAAATLEEIMADQTTPPAARVQASRAVLDNLLRLRELVEFDTRLKRLEDRINARHTETN